MKALSTLLLLSVAAHAQIVFDATSKELNAPPDANKIHCDFAFENKGKETVSIARYESTCSCMSVQISNGGKLDYAPGEKGVLRANFNMENFSGHVDKHVKLWMKGDADDAPTHSLVVGVNIPVLVDMQPKTVEWVKGDSMSPKIITVTMNHSEPIKLLKASSSNENFSVAVKTIEEGKKYELSVTPQVVEADRPGIAVLHLETDCKIEKQKKQMAFAIVRNERIAVAAPAAPQLGAPNRAAAETAGNK